MRVLRFSTLYGSKWVATDEAIQVFVLPVGFQYPLRVEVGCNNLGFNLVCGFSWFQYPLRVEVGCNVSVCLTCRRPSLFQYPLRVEVGCNHTD